MVYSWDICRPSGGKHGAVVRVEALPEELVAFSPGYAVEEKEGSA